MTPEILSESSSNAVKLLPQRLSEPLTAPRTQGRLPQRSWEPGPGRTRKDAEYPWAVRDLEVGQGREK